LQAQINEIMGLMKDAAKQPSTTETASNIVKYSLQLAQLEGAFITLKQYAPALEEIAKQYPVPPLPEPLPEAEPDAEPPPPAEPEVSITSGELEKRSPTLRRSKAQKAKKAKKNES
jgi:hypothetical protein